jgi:plastocyanin
MRTRVIKIAIATVVAGAALWAGTGVALAGGGCHSPSTAGRGHAVDIVDLCFVSTVLYVPPGTEVTWTNQDPIEHDVVGVGDSWGDPGVSLSLGDDVTYRFDEDGVYPYACWFHPGMVGAIVVGDGVGTGLAAAVATSGGDQGSAETASAGLAENGGDATAIWIVGTALVVGALAGAFVVAMRNRRKVSVAG